jgi:hypothetical protein
VPPSFAFTLDALKSARRCPLLGRAHGDGVILLGPKKGRVEEMRVYEAVDTTAIAQGMGAQGLTVRSLGDLDRIRPLDRPSDRAPGCGL